MADMTLSDISEQMRDIDFCMLSTTSESGRCRQPPDEQ